MTIKVKRILFILIFLCSIPLQSQLCKDYLIFDGSEPVISYGIDTTGNWWIITQPFGNYKRLIVNGEKLEEYNKIFAPVFSFDGSKWATFGEYQGTWYLITNDDIIELKATDIGNIGFTQNSKHLVYSYFRSNIEYIILPTKTIEVYGKVGSFFVNKDASQFAFKGLRGRSYVLNINGQETSTFDEIIPIGFWHDDNFVYAAKNGINWQIYKNAKPISQNYSNIRDPQINLQGTVLAFIATTFSNSNVAVTIADKFTEPLESRQYDLVSYLTLHPEHPIVAFFAKNQNNSYIVVNTAEYSTSANTSPPHFTNDGENIYFLACDFACYASINGIRYTLQNNISPQTPVAVKSNSRTIAYTTASSLIMLFLENNRMHSGMMVDKIISPIFNTKAKRYETIGQISNKLYLLTCQP